MHWKINKFKTFLRVVTFYPEMAKDERTNCPSHTHWQEARSSRLCRIPIEEDGRGEEGQILQIAQSFQYPIK
jgi:hypothetical protein